VLDIFMFCDLGGVSLSARGEMDSDDVDSLLRAIERLPPDCEVTIDLSDVFGMSPSDALRLDSALEWHHHQGSRFTILRATDPEDSSLDAA
jgi:hypothetical protein